MTVRAWIVSLCVMFLIGFCALFASSLVFSEKLFTNTTMPQITKSLRDKYELSLKNVVDVEAQNVKKRLEGVRDKEAIRRIVEESTDFQRFFDQDEGYYFTYYTSGVRINVPVNKSMNGKDCMGLKDSVGQPFIQNLVERAKAGGGFVEYLFEKPGAGVQPKLSYVRMIPGTDILIGTGVYIDSIALEQNRISSLVEENNERYSLYQMGIALGILVVLVVLAWYVIRLICNPLRSITTAVLQVANGDLDAKSSLSTKHPKEIDTLLYALRTMIKTLRQRIEEAAQKQKEATDAMEKAHSAQREAEVSATQAKDRQQAILLAAGELEDIATVLFSTATELSAQIEQSDRGAAESAHYLSESAKAMQDMNASVQDVARNAATASTASLETREKAQSGAIVVEQAVQAIEQVRVISVDLKQDITQLNEHAQAISQIMSVISDIADQTNLLALNAAIEAARAGEAGRGFSVVADEVRKLAEKTMNSTNDVGNAIRSIQTSTAKSVSSMDNAVQQIEQVTEFANNSGKALQEIVDTVGDSANQVNAIATASEEQSAASEQINRAIAQANDLSGQTASAMASASSAVSDLVAQARKLNTLIAEMKAGN